MSQEAQATDFHDDVCLPTTKPSSKQWFKTWSSDVTLLGPRHMPAAAVLGVLSQWLTRTTKTKKVPAIEYPGRGFTDRQGRLWHVTTKRRLAAEVGTTIDVIEHALRVLKERRLIESRVEKSEHFDMQRVTFVRIDWCELRAQMLAAGLEPSADGRLCEIEAGDGENRPTSGTSTTKKPAKTTRTSLWRADNDLLNDGYVQVPALKDLYFNPESRILWYAAEKQLIVDYYKRDDRRFVMIPNTDFKEGGQAYLDVTSVDIADWRLVGAEEIWPDGVPEEAGDDYGDADEELADCGEGCAEDAEGGDPNPASEQDAGLVTVRPNTLESNEDLSVMIKEADAVLKVARTRERGGHKSRGVAGTEPSSSSRPAPRTKHSRSESAKAAKAAPVSDDDDDEEMWECHG